MCSGGGTATFGVSADLPRLNRGFVLPSVFPGHALHEKSLQRQIGVGTLISSQERRALFRPGDLPRLNRDWVVGPEQDTAPHRIRPYSGYGP